LIAGGVSRRVPILFLRGVLNRQLPGGDRRANQTSRRLLIKQKQIEEPFGWMKTIGALRKTRHRGCDLVEWLFVLSATAYNFVLIPGFSPRRDKRWREYRK
jgi:hypothetical protein